MKNIYKQFFRSTCIIFIGIIYYIVLVIDDKVTATELYLWATALCIYTFTQLQAKWTIAFSFWLFVTIYTFAGAFIYLLREYFYFNHPGYFRVPINIWLLATLITALFAPFDTIKKTTRDDIPINLKINHNWTIVFISAGLISAFFMFHDNIPLFADDINAARARTVSETQGVFWFLYMGLQIILTLYFVEYVTIKIPYTTKLIRTCIIILLVSTLSLYGGRFFVFMPIIFSVAFLSYKGIVNSRHITIMVLSVLLLAISVSALRFHDSADDLGSMLEMGVRNDVFPEFRTLIQLEPLIQNFDISYIFNPFISFMPSAFYQLFDIDKNSDLMLSIGYYLSSFDDEAQQVGYRVTILGELYLALGYIGVIIGVLTVNITSVIAKNRTKNDLFYIYLVIMFCMLVPYGVTFIRSSIVMIPFGYLIMRLSINFLHQNK